MRLRFFSMRAALPRNLPRLERRRIARNTALISPPQTAGSEMASSADEGVRRCRCQCRDFSIVSSKTEKGLFLARHPHLQPSFVFFEGKASTFDRFVSPSGRATTSPASRKKNQHSRSFESVRVAVGSQEQIPGSQDSAFDAGSSALRSTNDSPSYLRTTFPRPAPASPPPSAITPPPSERSSRGDGTSGGESRPRGQETERRMEGALPTHARVLTYRDRNAGAPRSAIRHDIAAVEEARRLPPIPSFPRSARDDASDVGRRPRCAAPCSYEAQAQGAGRGAGSAGRRGPTYLL